MSLLTPWALLWLASLPVLIWLWRLATVKTRTVIPSLVPFEHLLKRPPTRRSRLFVNVLFWLQLSSLALLALALAQPALVMKPPKTILILLDTSASMQATLGGPSAFERAKRIVLNRVARKAPSDQIFLVTSTPPKALTAKPVSEPGRLRALIEALSPRDLGGSLDVAYRIGQALLAQPPDETLVVTDEPAPQRPGAARFETVGESLPNVAIVGLDTRGALCVPSASRLVVTLEHFSEEPQPVDVVVLRQGRRLAETTVELGGREQRPISLELPSDLEGEVEIRVRAARDALEVDNTAFLLLRQSERVPITVISERPEFLSAVSAWLDACPRLSWTLVGAEPQRAPSATPIVITDKPLSGDELDAEAVIRFTPSGTSAPPQVVHAFLPSPHPIVSYLPVVEPLTVRQAVLEIDRGGEPLLLGIDGGRAVPLVVLEYLGERRVISILMDPAANPQTPELLLVLFNSLRWLLSAHDWIPTGSPLLVPTLQGGRVTLRRPEGAQRAMSHAGGPWRYDETTEAGWYRLLHAGGKRTFAVNFLDPVEANLLNRRSTWKAPEEAASSSLQPARPYRALLTLLIAVILGFLILEWLLYAARAYGRRTRLP